jgi:chromate reductase
LLYIVILGDIKEILSNERVVKMTDAKIKIVAFAGSLRNGSVNRLLLRSAIKLAPANMLIEELNIHDVPLYNGDVEDEGPPQSVIDFKESVASADGLLIVSPEYNHGIPAVTKNLIDWASRRVSHPGNVLDGKPVSIMTMSGGALGIGSFVQPQIRQVLVYPGTLVMPNGDVGISGGISNFDEQGQLVNELAKSKVEQNLLLFSKWINRLNG